MRVTVGTKFHSMVLDGMPEFTVVSKRGRDTWNCEVLPGEGNEDACGYTKVFGTEEIVQKLRRAQFFEERAAKSEDWWASRLPGETVYYHNGFNQWVKGTIVRSVEDGQVVMKMLPTAMLGGWRAHDLPSRREDGSINYPHTAKRIVNPDDEPLERRLMRPNPSNMWGPEFKTPGGTDPTVMSEIDLTVPDMTDEEEREAAAAREAEELVRRVSIIRNRRDIPPSERLRLIRSTLAGA